jgi:hypothetical protein
MLCNTLYIYIYIYIYIYPYSVYGWKITTTMYDFAFHVAEVNNTFQTCTISESTDSRGEAYTKVHGLDFLGEFTLVFYNLRSVAIYKHL